MFAPLHLGLLFIATSTLGLASEVFSGGMGTVDDPYRISNRAEFEGIRQFPGAHFSLDADLDFQGVSWTPVAAEFTGVLDGKGHEILNLVINDSNGSHAALFTQVKDAVFRNLSISGSSTAYNPGRNVALLAGTSLRTRFDSVSVSGTTFHHWNDSAFQTDWVGILTAKSAHDTFIRCAATGSATGRVYVGGLAGGMSSGVIDESFADVTVHVRGFHTGGGLVGDVYGNSRIRNSYSRGTVTGSTGVSELGGLIGRLRQTSRLIDVYSSAAVIGDGANRGGLVGLNEVSDWHRPFTHAYWSSGRAGIAVSGGGTDLGAAENLVTKSNFAGWDFHAFWVFPTADSDEAAGPYLQGNPPTEHADTLIDDWLRTHGIALSQKDALTVNFLLGVSPFLNPASLIRIENSPSGRMIAVSGPRRFPLPQRDYVIEGTTSLHPEAWLAVSPPSRDWALDNVTQKPVFRRFINSLGLPLDAATPVFFRIRVIDQE